MSADEREASIKKQFKPPVLAGSDLAFQYGNGRFTLGGKAGVRLCQHSPHAADALVLHNPEEGSEELHVVVDPIVSAKLRPHQTGARSRVLLHAVSRTSPACRVTRLSCMPYHAPLLHAVSRAYVHNCSLTLRQNIRWSPNYLGEPDGPTRDPWPRLHPGR